MGKRSAQWDLDLCVPPQQFENHWYELTMNLLKHFTKKNVFPGFDSPDRIQSRLPNGQPSLQRTRWR